MRTLLALIFLIAATTACAAQTRPCDRAVPFQHTAPTSAVELVPPMIGQRVYLCGFLLAQKGPTLDFQIMSGEGSNCSINRLTMTPVLSLPVDVQIVSRIENVGPSTPPNHGLCIETTGAGGLTGLIYYAQF